MSLLRQENRTEYLDISPSQRQNSKKHHNQKALFGEILCERRVSCVNTQTKIWRTGESPRLTVMKNRFPE
jgi:hypothetical protein